MVTKPHSQAPAPRARKHRCPATKLQPTSVSSVSGHVGGLPYLETQQLKLHMPCDATCLNTELERLQFDVSETSDSSPNSLSVRANLEGSRILEGEC